MADPRHEAEKTPDLESPSELSQSTHSSSYTVNPDSSGSPRSDVAIEPVAPLGSLLGPYLLLEKLGEGGMGAVYKAQHQHLDKTVAVKVLSPQVTRHTGAVGRFKREMKAVGKLNHPNIVQAHDAGEIHGTLFLAMEYVDGTDLSRLVRERGPMSVSHACEALRQAAQALAAAHAVGLVHRDIKPANLLLTKSGQIKLLDLGLALLGDDAQDSTELTSAGQTFGTPDYMAPEQWEDAHLADARTDLYALGCTLFYLLVGHAPYGTNQHRSTLRKMRAHADDAIPELQSFRTDVPAAVEAIYRKLMAKAPGERFQTAAELVEALTPFSSIKGTHTEAATLIQMDAAESRSGFQSGNVKSSSPTTVAHETPQPAESGKRASRRRLAVAVGAVAILALCVPYFIVNQKDLQRDLAEEIGTRKDLKRDLSNNLDGTGREDRNTERASNPPIQSAVPRPELPLAKPVPAPPVAAINAEPDANQPAVTGEPLPLGQWLKGRTLLTVSQDGSAQFISISAALNALQPGQVVKVLDRGPYLEYLRPTKKIPADCGLISDQQTLIAFPAGAPDWLPSPDGQSVFGHSLDLTSGFRLHGFALAFPERSEGRGLLVSDPDGFVLENCFLRIPPGDVACRAVQLNALKQDFAKSVVIRDCLFDGRLGLTSNSTKLDAIIVRNFFSLTLPDEHFYLQIANPVRAATIRHNVFAAPAQCFISLHRIEGTEILDVANNTFQSSTALLFEKSVPRGTVRLSNNLFAERGGALVPVGVPFDAFGTWEISFNACREYWVGLGTLQAIPPSPTDIHISLQFLSDSPVNSKYLRISTNSPLATSDVNPGYIGALPPGPAPQQGDWFTRVRTQWGNSIPPPPN